MNYLSCPVPSMKQTSIEFLQLINLSSWYFRCENFSRLLVILNLRSGRGCTSKAFYGVVGHVFKVVGLNWRLWRWNLLVNANKLVSTIDISIFLDGVVCVGGDAMINEVLNGLLGRDTRKEGISIPIGIFLAGLNNFRKMLLWWGILVIPIRVGWCQVANRFWANLHHIVAKMHWNCFARDISQ